MENFLLAVALEAGAQWIAEPYVQTNRGVSKEHHVGTVREYLRALYESGAFS